MRPWLFWLILSHFSTAKRRAPLKIKLERITQKRHISNALDAASQNISSWVLVWKFVIRLKHVNYTRYGQSQFSIILIAEKRVFQINVSHNPKSTHIDCARCGFFNDAQCGLDQILATCFSVCNLVLPYNVLALCKHSFGFRRNRVEPESAGLPKGCNDISFCKTNSPFSEEGIKFHFFYWFGRGHPLTG